MTKPAVTLRDTKGSPLTNDELDTNFENLRDATFTLTADTGGTQVVSDLNGVITLVAGSGVTLTGDNTGKTITIDAGAANLTSNDLRFGASDTGDVVFNPPSGYSSKNLVIAFDTVEINSPTGANILQANGTDFTIAQSGNGTMIQFDSSNIELETDNGTGQIYLYADELDLRTLNTSGVECRLVVGNYTTSERNAISTTQTGTIIFNETTSKFQGYDGTNWVDLN